MSLNKVMMYKGFDQEKPRILLLAPTGVAAVHINGTTSHLGLQINVGGKMFPLNDRQRAVLRNKLSEIKDHTGKKHFQIKLQRLEEVRIWAFGLLVH